MTTKNQGKHLNHEQRKIIASRLAVGARLKDIAELLDMDPTSISKEVRRNRVVKHQVPQSIDRLCRTTTRFPYVCNGCPKRYEHCGSTQYQYSADKAQQAADFKLVHSRLGIDLTPEELLVLDQTVAEGLKQNKSIYQIQKENPQIMRSPATVYRYIDKHILSVKKMDLPCAVTYKKRKKANKKYDYSHDRFDLSNRTYVDYLAFMSAHPAEFPFQMDFLGSIKGDSKAILTLIIPIVHFPLIFLVDQPNSAKVVAVFRKLEDRLGLEGFQKVFPYGLTDRDPCFSDFEGIETSHHTGERRTRLFFCDAFTSSQKGSVENLNHQLRRYFPKKESVDQLSRNYIREVQHQLLVRPVKALDGATPEQAFIKVYGQELYDALIEY